MADLSSTVSFLTKSFSGVFDKKSIESLVVGDQISYQCAAEAVSAIDLDGSRGLEATSAVNISGQAKEDIQKKANELYLKNVKLDAMINQVKEDDTLLYTEFMNLENLRKEVIGRIVQKEEFNLNQLLNECKTAGAKAEVIDELVQTKVKVDDLSNI